jgi:hypothetical protein
MIDVDHDALTRAMEIARRDPGRAWQLDQKLTFQAWEDVAAFAAYNCQADALNLAPFESPPCVVDEHADDTSPAGASLSAESRPAARRLLRHMLAAGLSRYEPDPLRAMANIKRVK